MRVAKAILAIILVLTGFGSARMQAGRTLPPKDGTPDRRPADPTPTPTPVPSAVESPAAPDDGDIIKVSTQLVSLPVRVMDKKGRFIAGLTKGDFKVFEDGVEQDIALFSNEEESFTVALVLDMSYSTTFKIAEIQSAALAFIDQLRPQDKVLVISFDEDVHVLCEATNDRKEIYRAIRSTRISTGTSIYEAMALAMNDKLRPIEGRKAIILFTDGVDTTSHRASSFDNQSDAMELDALIYPIRYDTFQDVQSMKNGSVIPKPTTPTTPTTPANIPTSGDQTIRLPQTGTSRSANERGTTIEEYQTARQYLDDLAYRTGGRTYEATTLGNLSLAYSKIASELREFYGVGYYPKDDRVPGKTTTIKVHVSREGLVVMTREGYLVPKKIKTK